MKFKWVKWLWLNWDVWSHSNCNYTNWGYGFNRVYIFHWWTPLLVGYFHFLPTKPDREEGFKTHYIDSIVDNCHKYGRQDCFMCPDLACCDNSNYLLKLRTAKEKIQELGGLLNRSDHDNNRLCLDVKARDIEATKLKKRIAGLEGENVYLWSEINWAFDQSSPFGKHKAEMTAVVGTINHRLYDILRAKERADDESQAECGIETKTRP